MARPRGTVRKPVTDEMLRQIEALAGYGLTEAAIAHIVGVPERTWQRRRKEFLAALEKGKAQAAGIVAKALFRKATEDKDLGAIVWWEKTRAGRSDRAAIELSGRDGGPIKTHVAVEIVDPDVPADADEPESDNGDD